MAYDYTNGTYEPINVDDGTSAPTDSRRPPPRPEDLGEDGLFGDRDGDGTPNFVDFDDGEGWLDTNKPIILDLDNDGIEIEFGGTTYFDWDDDGYKEAGSWASADDGFLVIDLNADGTRGTGDGKITQAKELVFSLWGDGELTDLQALAEATDDQGNFIFDSDGNGKLNANDDVWDELHIWQDLDQDGETDDGELKTLGEWGITNINLTYDDGSDYEDTEDNITIFGNTLHGLASYTRNGAVVEGGVGDVSLSYNTSGWREVETEDGFKIEFESGASFQYGVLEGKSYTNLNLTNKWLDGATGDDRNNTLNATGHMLSVSISGGMEMTRSRAVSWMICCPATGARTRSMARMAMIRFSLMSKMSRLAPRISRFGAAVVRILRSISARAG